MHARFSLRGLHDSILVKAVSLAIVVSFVLSPVAPVFAQDASTTGAPTESAAPTDMSDASAEPPTGGGFSIPGVETTSPGAGDSGATPTSETSSTQPEPTTNDQSSSDQIGQDANNSQTMSSLSSPGSDGGPTVPIPGIFTSQFSHTDALTG